MKWYKCDVCRVDKYCEEETFQNHREDCLYKQGRTQAPVPLDPSTHDCPSCGGNVVKVGGLRHCSGCGAVIGGGSAVIQ